MEQKWNDAARAQLKVTREQEINEVATRLNDANSEEAYFLDVIEYFNAKLVVLSAIEKSLNPKDVQA